MESIYAPWRMEYIKREKMEGCVFCKESIRDQSYVLYEGRHVYVIMNRYPYVTGHLLITPCRHIQEIDDLSWDEKCELFDMIGLCVGVLKKAINPHGFNIGMNLGEAAGAGIADHLHLHIVPRWRGDTNFMTTLGEIRIVSEDIQKTKSVLMPFFKQIKPRE